ncbi:MAG: transcriptional regulator [Thermoplasmata archaeon]
MEQARERAIANLRSLLERGGFYVSDAHGIRPSSFDLAARRDSLLVLLKVLKNIDTLSREEAVRLTELGQLFPAVVLIVGQTSGASELEPGVVYTRYDIPIIREETLADLIEKAVPPFLLSAPGGVFARIDGERLRALREARDLSLGAMAQIAGVSRHSIQLYEEGGGAEIIVVERVERYFGEPVAVPVDLLLRPSAPEPPLRAPETEAEPRGDERARPRSPDPLRASVFDRLYGMGWDVVPTVRAPFDAFTRTPHEEEVREILLTAIGSLRTAQHRAELLRELARVTERHAMFVVPDPYPRPSIDGLPVLSVRELGRHRGREELLDEIEERERA